MGPSFEFETKTSFGVRGTLEGWWSEDSGRVLGGILMELLRWVPRVSFELLKWRTLESASGLLMRSSTEQLLLNPPVRIWGMSVGNAVLCLCVAFVLLEGDAVVGGGGGG